MLKVKTFVAPSKISGFGCFAVELIKCGDVVWEYTRGYDRSFSVSDFNSLCPTLKTHFRRYAYYNQWEKKFIYCCDNGKFINHSVNPNLVEEGRFTIALFDIKKGEELLSNYHEFCGNLEDHKLK